MNPGSRILYTWAKIDDTTAVQLPGIVVSFNPGVGTTPDTLTLAILVANAELARRNLPQQPFGGAVVFVTAHAAPGLGAKDGVGMWFPAPEAPSALGFDFG